MSPHASVQCLLVFMTLSYGFLTLGPAPKCIPHPDRWRWVSDSWRRPSHTSFSPTSLQIPLLYSAIHFTYFPLPNLWVDFITALGLTLIAMASEGRCKRRVFTVRIQSISSADPSTLCTPELPVGAQRILAELSDILAQNKGCGFYFSFHSLLRMNIKPCTQHKYWNICRHI